MSAHPSPRLLADIGGTYARFTLDVGSGPGVYSAQLRCADHASFLHTVQAYLATVPGPRPVQAAVAMANPVDGDVVRMTNSPWSFSIEDMRQQLGLDTLLVVNDFTALAMAVPRLSASGLRPVGGGSARERSVMGVIGPGTGLGMSGLIPAQGGWVALGAEGGHASFSPRDERELTILRHAWRQYRHVSMERLLSGQGLELIHAALAEQAGQPVAERAHTAPDITQRALDRSDKVCEETLDAFCAMLGTAASNLAVTLGALGGIYVGGGIVPRLGEFFDRSAFRARFEDKGRFSDYLRQVPTWVIEDGEATFRGLSAILEAHLSSHSREGRASVLNQIRRGLDHLSKAERKVADHVLQHARQTLNEPIADIARQAQVSQPTVIRFCRSMGCEGLSDFKLRLASSLNGTVPVTHTQVTPDDSITDLGGKVLGNTAAAILQLRPQLHREHTERAIDLLNRADRVGFYALGYTGVVAQDAAFKFMRLGVACQAYTDPRLQRLSMNLSRPQDLAVLISSSGEVDELLDLADTARRQGTPVVAITASQSALARRADLPLWVDHSEDLDTHVPMVSRVLQLLVVDILAVGVALRRGHTPALQAPDWPEGGKVSALGQQVSPPLSPLARLSSHSR